MLPFVAWAHVSVLVLTLTRAHAHAQILTQFLVKVNILLSVYFLWVIRNQVIMMQSII